MNGGGVFFKSIDFVTFQDCNLSKNIALIQGGAISITKGLIKLSSSNLTSNSASLRGGAIYMRSLKYVAPSSID